MSLATHLATISPVIPVKAGTNGSVCALDVSGPALRPAARALRRTDGRPVASGVGSGLRRNDGDWTVAFGPATPRGARATASKGGAAA